jgi:arylsulfatase A-like enzyme
MKKKLLLLLLLFYNTAVAQRNTVLIIADDVGTDYFGWYTTSGDTVGVPNLRQLFSNGLVFTNYWTSPICSPTRAEILTGRYPFRTGVGQVVSVGTPELDTAEYIIPAMLKDHAIVPVRTACIGKWHVQRSAPTVHRLYPNQMGFDLYSGNFSGELADYYNWTRIKNGLVDTITTYATTQTIDDAIAFLDTLSPGTSFFLWIAFNAPHSPYHKPPSNLISNPGLPGTPGHINANPALYFKAAIEALDAETGRLISFMQQHGLTDSTNFIFMGDNGNDKRVAQIADTSHVKGTLYEYGVHVPLLVKGPDIVQGGRTSDALVSGTDLFATIAEWSGINNWNMYLPPGTISDSKSIMPLVKNDTTDIRSWMFTEKFETNPVATDGKTIRNKTHQLISFDNGNCEFYNLVSDPLEQNNLLVQGMSSIDSVVYTTLRDSMNQLVLQTACQGFATGLSSVVVERWSVSPNPVNGHVRIMNAKADDLFQLINSKGNIVAAWNGSESGQLYVSDGLYLVQRMSDRSIHRVQVIHQY